ncbi:DSBA domain-containing protein [Heracleum sosnowskyi]|uniref:DSBA domain-containing protein n=1 Tax=Heracleum sosnowskyi TaxID=360622 RepID=A0AAD8H5F4_9APIA|nr:DSBA domain-containing protein [Heracleum sosnowskyi]
MFLSPQTDNQRFKTWLSQQPTICAIASSKIHYDFKVVWHPFFLNPSAPTEGVPKKEFYRSKFGSRADQMHSRMTEVFKNVGLEYNMSGLTGNSMDSHRLIHFAGQQDLGKQHDLVEELFIGYFTQGKYIGDRQFLVESANKVGVGGAAEFLQNPDNGRKEVHEEIKKYSANISGVPFYTINGKYQLSGGQPPEAFLRAFSAAAADST